MGSTFSAGADIPVAYAHSVEYFSKGIDQQGPFYRVRYYIDNWSDSDAVVNFMLGKVSNTGGSSGTSSFTAPHRHPLSPNLYCVSAIAEGMGKPQLNASGYPAYPNGRGVGGAMITAEYRPMTPYPYEMTPAEVFQQIDPETPLVWCTQELDFTTEMYTIANSQTTWAAGPQNGKSLQGYPFRIRVPLTTMNLTFHKVPYMPAGKVRSLQGYVNSSAFLGCDTGSVYYSGARVVRDYSTDGTVVQKVMQVFVQRTRSATPSGAPAGATGQLWNSIPNPKDLQWYPVVGPNSGLLYPTADFSSLVVF